MIVILNILSRSARRHGKHPSNSALNIIMTQASTARFSSIPLPSTIEPSVTKYFSTLFSICLVGRLIR